MAIHIKTGQDAARQSDRPRSRPRHKTTDGVRPTFRSIGEVVVVLSGTLVDVAGTVVADADVVVVVSIDVEDDDEELLVVVSTEVVDDDEELLVVEDVSGFSTGVRAMFLVVVWPAVTSSGVVKGRYPPAVAVRVKFPAVWSIR